jgi:predicted nucleic acid-binding protein
MSSSVFLDTNGWIALLNATEQLHARAYGIWLDLGQRGYRIVLTDWIIAETGNGVARSRARTIFAEAIARLLQNPLVEVVNVDERLMARALDHFRRYTDKTWGLVDCASFVVMKDRGITEAFTSDHDFEQAGFRCLITA